MKETTLKIKELSKKFEEFKKSFDLKKKKTHLLELEAKTGDPKFWEDRKAAKVVMQELGNLKEQLEQVGKVEQVVQDAQAAADLGMEKELKERVDEAKMLIDKLELSTFLSGPYDNKNAILSIHAGQGGTEAMDWASMLYRMYLRFCERRKWKTKVIDMSEGEEAGIKSATFKAKGHYAYGYLKGEIGTHRLVRQSPFNADRLRQTSFALVEVLPEFEEVDIPDIEIGDDDLEWQFFRASTQGGQNVQKVSSAVRLKHKPTSVTVTAQQERTQEQNRKIAMNLLRARLWVLELAKKEAQKRELKGEYRPASWGNQIRSYVLHPYKMVKDLRTEVETEDTEAVLDGDLNQFIEAELKLAVTK